MRKIFATVLLATCLVVINPFGMFSSAKNCVKVTFAQNGYVGDNNKISINLTDMKNFSGLSTDEILQKRIAAVNSSPILKNLKSYTPSESVFQLADKARWISAREISCYGVSADRDISKGPSRESVGILNPELLYYIAPESYAFSKTSGCSSVDYLFPSHVFYNARTNTIYAYINYRAFYNKNGTKNVFIRDANARDLGYNYAYADKVKNIHFHQANNLSNTLVNLQGFYHLGHSCGHPDGCNNYSPHQAEYDFYVEKIPARLRIALYKDAPATDAAKGGYGKADINFEFIFQ